MKQKTSWKIIYPIQALIALPWLFLGIAWLFSRPLTGGKILIAVLFIGVALLMLLDCTERGHQWLNQFMRK
ncbi:hypothetical protein [Bombilactobacillus bombi]|uniref:hypothetical protein n=1 Tax=Bombilactobacillus bombi TaxID=1303590 RepID=UPI0015E5AAC2|nr:hypothetical protein [Bombilactobacillus bombi]MBA1434491.1 hypothetical protein [Bombilactobacillus bombi]